MHPSSGPSPDCSPRVPLLPRLPFQAHSFPLFSSPSHRPCLHSLQQMLAEQLINNRAINQTDTQPLPLETFLLGGCNQILNAGELTTAGREKSPGGKEAGAPCLYHQVSSAPLSPSPPLPDGKLVLICGGSSHSGRRVSQLPLLSSYLLSFTRPQGKPPQL